MVSGTDTLADLPRPIGRYTYNEHHALILGLLVGTTAALIAIQHPVAALAHAAFFDVAALGFLYWLVMRVTFGSETVDEAAESYKEQAQSAREAAD